MKNINKIVICMVLLGGIIVTFTFNRKEKLSIQNSSHENDISTTNVELISTNFKHNKFNDGNELKLLKELNLCDVSISGEIVGSCSPRFFRFFKLNDNVSLNDAFLLLINGIVYPNDKETFKSRRILIYEREKNRLMLTNAFKGNLIERHKNTKSKYDDLVIRFRLDEFDEAYHCKFKWKNGKYKFESCEELFSYYCKGKVKPQLKDSVSIEVLKILNEKNLIF